MKSLAPIQRLADGLFNQKWQRLHADGSLQTDKLSYPGVYLLAYTGKKLEGMGINPRDVLYVGMSNSAGGVRQRLDQFMTGIKKNTSHSGAMRFYREFSNSRPFSETGGRKRFYFAAKTVPCESRKAFSGSDDFRKMGHVACLEYYIIARIKDETGRAPRLNKIGSVKIATAGKAK